MKRLAWLVLLLTVAAQGRTRYVSAAGADTNNGTTTATAWLHAPGMTGCANTCAAFTPTGGDSVIVRGGDTYHRGNSGASPYIANWTWTWSGSSGNKTYLGVDNTTVDGSGAGTIGWYNPAVCGSSWCRPIIQGDNPHSTTESVSCQFGSKSAITFDGNYIIFDNFEIDGICADANAGTTFIGRNNCGQHDNVYENNYVHGWTFIKNGNNDPYYRQNYYFFYGDTGGCQPYPQNHQEFAYNYITDAPGGVQESPHGTGTVIYGECYNWHHNYMRGMANFVCNNGHNMHDNTWEYFDDNTGHANVMEYNDQSNETNYFYNNMLRHIGVTSPYGAGAVLWFLNGNQIQYTFNNVIYDTHANNNFWDNGSAGQSYNLFNNTLANPPDALEDISVATNNHMITSFTASGMYRGAEQPTITTQRTATATTEANGGTGYVAGNEFAPTATYHPTSVTGTNLKTTMCDAMGDTDAAAACMLSTTGGVAVSDTTHSVTGASIATHARPTSTAWDIGAYQFVSGLVDPPTNLTATVK